MFTNLYKPDGEEMPQALFSVILPTFNRAHTLPTAIESVRDQLMNSWELIVVDDGSMDDTKRVVSLFIRMDSRIRYIRQTNQGPSAARNAGMSAALGDYFAFIDSDDTFTPDHLQSRLDVFLNDPRVEFIYGSANIIGCPLIVDRYDPSQLVSLEDESVRICGTFTLRKAAASKIGGFPPMMYSEEGEYFIRAQRAGLNFSRVQSKTYNYNRTSPDSICTRVLETRSFR